MMQFYVPEVVAVEQVSKMTFGLVLRLVNGLENHCEAREHFAVSACGRHPSFSLPVPPAMSDQIAPAGINCYTKFFFELLLFDSSLSSFFGA